MPRKDRKRHDPDLEQFVELANMLPRTRELPLPWEPDQLGAAEELLEELSAAFVARFGVSVTDTISHQLATGQETEWLQPPTAMQVGQTYDPHAVPSDTTARRWTKSALQSGAVGALRIGNKLLVITDKARLYRLAYFVRGTLLAIAHATKQGQLSGTEMTVPVPETRTLVLWRGRPIKRKAEPYADQFTTVLEATHPDRLRQCPVETCGRLYIARRGHASACSTRCCNVVRNRRLRAAKAKVKSEFMACADLTPEAIDTQPVIDRRARRRARRNHSGSEQGRS